MSQEVQERVNRFCGGKRTATYYDQSLHQPPLIHWNAWDPPHRIPELTIHSSDSSETSCTTQTKSFCAAGRIVRALNKEANGSWSSLHVRRGDLQYKEVKIPAAEWYNNTKDVWKEESSRRSILGWMTIGTLQILAIWIPTFWEWSIPSSQVTGGRLLEPGFPPSLATSTECGAILAIPSKPLGMVGFLEKMPSGNGNIQKENYPAREWPLGWVAIDGDEWIEHEADLPASSSSSVQTPPKETSTEDKDQNPSPDIHEKKAIILSDLQGDEGFRDKPVARGEAGRPMSETPTLEGARRAHIDCEVNVDSLAYWNDPTGTKRSEFRFADKEKFMTFSVDPGRWNNVRMSMEIIFVLAAATGRTLVLPPKEPLYRLRADNANVHRGFADFFNLGTPEFAKRLKTITMEEFVKREGGPDGQVPIPEEMRENVLNNAQHCDKRKAGTSYCSYIDDFLDAVGHVPDFGASHHCVVFDKAQFEGKDLAEESEKTVAQFCGERTRFYWTSELEEHNLIHIQAGVKAHRLLTHYYDFIHFTDPAIGNYFKRFIRDFLHYNDQIYCAAVKIVTVDGSAGK
eukprot:scaffold713_cov131-Cylindrotheca_fusiformis.AAC.12